MPNDSFFRVRLSRNRFSHIRLFASGFAFKPAYRVRAELNIRCMVMQAGIMVDSFFLNAFQLISGSERHICRVIIIYVAANNNPVNPGGKQFRFHGFDCFGHIPLAGFRQAQPITQFRGSVQKTDVVHTDTTEKIIFRHTVQAVTPFTVFIPGFENISVAFSTSDSDCVPSTQNKYSRMKARLSSIARHISSSCSWLRFSSIRRSAKILSLNLNFP